MSAKATDAPVETPDDRKKAVEAATSKIDDNIRDMAKWIVTGLAGLSALAVGSSTISHIGAMEINWRFYLAIIALISGLALFYRPLRRAVDIMTMKPASMGDIFNGAEFSSARKSVEERFLIQIEPELNTFKKLDLAYSTAVADFKTNPTDDNRALMNGIMKRVYEALPWCKTTKLREDIDALLAQLPRAAFLAFTCFGIFSWAANPAEDKTGDKKIAKPFLVPIVASGSNDAVLKAAGLSDECLKPGPLKFFALAERSALRTELLAVPAVSSEKCLPVRVVFRDGQLTAAD